MVITEIYSGATYFGVPLGPYMWAYLGVMILFLGPTLISLAWALTVGQGRVRALRLVRPLGRFGTGGVKSKTGANPQGSFAPVLKTRKKA